MIGQLLAHGIGGRTDLPLPAWQLAWAAGFAVASSFVALGVFWEQPRLALAATGRRIVSLRSPGARALGVLSRLVGLFVFGVVLFAAWRGNTNPAVNIAGDAFLIWFWVGMQFAAALLGDVGRVLNPLVTLADTAAWVRAKVTRTEMSPVGHGAGTLWPAVAAIFAYVWYELAYHSTDSPRSIGVFLTAYAVAILGGAVWYGRGWARSADGFAVLFTKLAAMAPLYRDEEGDLRLRPPLAGLTALPDTPGTVPFILVVLGSTTFDGFTRSSLWFELAGGRVGWERTIVHTLGLVVVIGLVAGAYTLAINVIGWLTGDDPVELSRLFGPSLVPIAAAYAVAHYFSLLVINGQRIYIQLSDPFGRGWDLFGTKAYAIDFTVVSPETIAWVQTVAIAVGHVLAVAAAHDTAVARYDRATAVRSQYPMLAVMITYTVVGLFLLLGA